MAVCPAGSADHRRPFPRDLPQNFLRPFDLLPKPRKTFIKLVVLMIISMIAKGMAGFRDASYHFRGTLRPLAKHEKSRRHPFFRQNAQHLVRQLARAVVKGEVDHLIFFAARQPCFKG
ncbi:hypothetical protein D1872_248290 [compost metagenome]